MRDSTAGIADTSTVGADDGPAPRPTGGFSLIPSFPIAAPLFWAPGAPTPRRFRRGACVASLSNVTAAVSPSTSGRSEAQFLCRRGCSQAGLREGRMIDLRASGFDAAKRLHE